MVGADDDRVALEELVRPAGGLDQRPDRSVATSKRLLRTFRTERVGGEVVVRQVVEEEVEPVTGHEPAPDGCRVGVDGASRAAEDGHRRAGHIRLEEVVEKETLRAERGPRKPGQQSDMARAAAIAGDVDRGCREAVVLERLVDGDRVRAEVLLVHVEDRVQDRSAGSRGSDGGERRAVLDDALLLAVIPDEVRDPVDVRV